MEGKISVFSPNKQFIVFQVSQGKNKRTGNEAGRPYTIMHALYGSIFD
jgi:hypothetical protein